MKPYTSVFPLLLAIAMCATPGLAQGPVRGQNHTPHLPHMGDGGLGSLSAERRLGERIMREIVTDPDFIDDPYLQDYLNGIWQKLRVAAKQRGEISSEMDDTLAWRAFLLKDKSINAFALPGGFMGVHLGLMASLSQEQELVAVLAHELSHISQRHVARLMDKSAQQAPLYVVATILGVLAARNNPQAITAALVTPQALAIQSQLNFSRDMEREADRVGLSVMTDAGYAPQGMVNMLELLERSSRLNDNGSFPYLRTHPLSTERVAEVKARSLLDAPLAPVVATDTSRNPEAHAAAALYFAMVSARAKVLTDTRMAALRQAMLSSQTGLREQDKRTAAGANKVTLQENAQRIHWLYAGTLAASRVGEHALAQEWLKQLQDLLQRSMGNASAVPWQSGWHYLAAEAALAANKPDAAMAHISQLQSINAPQRSTLLLRSRALLAMQQAPEVTQTLNLWLSQNPSDNSAWELMAQAHKARGQAMLAVRAEAEILMNRHQYAAAADRLKAAQNLGRAPQNDAAQFVDLSIIDSRLRHAQTMHRQQVQADAEFK